MGEDEFALERILQYKEAYLALLLLDLEPIRDDLEACYCPTPRGYEAYDAVAMFRTFLLMGIREWSHISTWPQELAGHPELRILSGFEEGEIPQRTCLRDFPTRLLDGPYQKPCDCIERPSEGQRGKSFLRNLKEEKEEAKRALLEKKSSPSEKRSQQAVRDALESLSSSQKPDFIARMNELLWKCAVVPSIEKGLMGDITKLLISGDGSALESQANKRGKKTCECFSQGIEKCDCDRLYSDPDATWGYDSTNKVNFFGAKVHAFSTYHNHHDFPLFVSVNRAATPDVVLGSQELAILEKFRRNFLPEGRFQYGAFDKAYDANAFYELLAILGIAPLIPINTGNLSPNPPGKFKRDEKGCPLCPGGVPMKLRGASHNRGHNTYICPAKYQGRTNGKIVWKVNMERCPLGKLCEPDSKMGPLLYLRFNEDYRYNPIVPRESNKFKELFKQRSSPERLFSQWEKPILSSRIHRRHHLYQMRLTCAAINIHAKIWAREHFDIDSVKTGKDVIACLEQILHDSEKKRGSG